MKGNEEIIFFQVIYDTNPRLFQVAYLTYKHYNQETFDYSTL